VNDEAMGIQSTETVTNTAAKLTEFNTSMQKIKLNHDYKFNNTVNNLTT